ncbi:MAG: alpha/beta family hydrolase [Bacteroidota bacterium]
MEATSYTFEATPEKGEVSALLIRPEGAEALLVFGHGAGAGMTHANMEAIAQAMGRHGIATFRYNFVYMEHGRGRGSQKVSVATVAAAVKKAQSLAPDLPCFVGGHSYGGRMSTHAAAEGLLSGIKGLIFGSFPLHAPGKPGIARAAHLVDIGLPMLFLSGERDTFAQQDLLHQVVDPLPDAEIHWLETGNHGYKILKRTRQNPEDIFEEMGRVAARWIAGLPTS